MTAFVHQSLPSRSRRSPGGRKIKIAKEEKPAAAKCAVCGAKLQAVPRRSNTQMSRLARTLKRPQRPFGGILCSNCSRSMYKEKVRLDAGLISKDDVDVKRLRFLKTLR
jgi:large subunit ribosomal protein L34e